MSESREQLLEQLEGLGTSLTAVLDRLSQVELEMAAAKSEASGQISAVRDFLNSPQISALAGPEPSAGADVGRANEAIQKLSVGETQEQILEIFLEEVNALSDRAILFLQEGDSYSAYKCLGFDPSILDSAQVGSEEDPIRRSARQQRIIYQTDELPGAFPWLSGAGEAPATAVCVPLVFEETAPLVLYADSSRGIELDSLELLSHLAVLVLKNHYLMARLEDGVVVAEEEPTAPLAGSSEPVSPVGVMTSASPPPFEETEPAEVKADLGDLLSKELPSQEVDEPPAPEAGHEEPAYSSPESVLPIEPAQDEVEDLRADAEDLNVEELEKEAEIEDLTAEPAVEPSGDTGEVVETQVGSSGWPRLFGASEQVPTTEDPVTEGQETSQPEELTDEVVVEDLQDEILTFETGSGDEATVEGPMATSNDEVGAVELDLGPLPGPEAEAPVEPEPAQPLDEEAERKHEEARRFARLLVSEIKLYHEEKVKEGRQNSDLYERLQRDIDRSQAMYERRADASVRATHDHFHTELIRILAEGDETRLGPDYPGPTPFESD